MSVCPPLPNPNMDTLSEFRDWANLPPEMVELISRKVKYIVDFIRFRAVCSTWRSVSCPKGHHLPPQRPWLMLPYDWDLYKKNGGTRFFYDVWESKMREFHLPKTMGMTCCASYRGWLLLVSYKGREVCLLNPLTRSRIKLPPFMTWFDPYYISFGMSKMIFSPGQLITVFLESDWVISCRVGDRSWKRYYPSEDLVDATRYKGRLYLLYKGKMEIIKPNKLKHKCVLKPNFTVVFDPDLTAIKKGFVQRKTGVYIVGVHPEGKFVLYEFQKQHMKLRKIATDTSNSTAIFFGDNYPCLALSSDDWDSLDGGSLYMEHKCVPGVLKLAALKSGYKSRYVQMVDGNVMMKYEGEHCEAEPAMWFQPSLF
ncbi:F-box protein (DUF295) [Rhynchospora pubera]|uniref:F-box protein (DUF295) n=1 Tax=Rhynchospora pubera TaxID=906938 RepID=A0AAV8EM63_9POAL|nr:F-box protein (DUF295) [Rhynchospora pubera]